jgi:hypothetical protein
VTAEQVPGASLPRKLASWLWPPWLVLGAGAGIALLLERRRRRRSGAEAARRRRREAIRLD